MSRFLFPVLLMSVMAHAYALGPEDYAYGISLHIEDDKPMHQLTLPEAVYQHSVYANLRDVQVFNASGESVPFSLQFPEQAETESQALPLPFFPVRTDVENTARDNDLQIELDEDGRITGITSSVREDADTQTSYIIDVSDLDGHIETLSFDVTAAGGSFVQHFALDTGTDLNHWRVMQPEATLARLQHDDQTLERSTLTLARQPEDYLRLRWIGDEIVELQGVTAVITDTTATAQTDTRQWQNISGDPEENNVFHYDLKAHYPIDRISLQLPDINTLALARFESRPDRESVWRLRGQQRVYRLQTDGITLGNEALVLDRQTDRYWRVMLDNGGTFLNAPQLRVGWLPQQLVFLARGDGPYVLAYGRAEKDASSNAHQLVQIQVPEQSVLVGDAEAGTPFPLGGQTRLEASTAPNWRQVGLWATLLIAVFILGVMAVRLFRDMNRNTGGT